MAYARQARRLARQWAEILGASAGIEAVDDFLLAVQAENSAEDNESELNRAALLATIAPSQLGWDEGAVQAGAARIDHCPKGHEAAYYRAYEAAAVDRVHFLAD